METLNKLFYDDKLGISSKVTFINEVRKRHPEIKLKDIQGFLKNQEINQVATDIKKSYQYKITAPPRSFQIDIFWFRRSETLTPILLLVDILSRKAFAYTLSKNTQDNILDTLNKFKNEVGEINFIEGDNEFNKTNIKEFCKDNKTSLVKSVFQKKSMYQKIIN